MAFVVLPSLVFANKTADLTLPVGPNNVYDLTQLQEDDTLNLFGTQGANYANAWRVLNPTTREEESTSQALKVRKDDEGNNYLSFDASTLSEEAFLALRIGTISNENYTPYVLKPADSETNKIITHELVITSRYEPSADLPSMELMKRLYGSYDDAIAYSNVAFYAAKMGVCVKDNDYFYIARVKANQDLNTTVGSSLDLTFEWVKTNIVYAPEPANPVDGCIYVGNGRVDLKVHACTYRAENDPFGFKVAYRLEIRKASNNPDDPYVSLSDGLGYIWTDGTEAGTYEIDFTSIGKGEWLFPIDNASVGTYGNDVNGNLDLETLDTWNMVAFSASAGGLYKVELLDKKEIANISELALLYNVGNFANYATLTSSNFSLFEDWVRRYDVNLTEGLTPLTRSYAFSASTVDKTSQTFNAFILDMDPTLDVTQKLTVTAIRPEQKEMVLTVKGPEGCSLKNAISRAGRLYVKRAASLEALANAAFEPLVGASIATISEEELLVTLPNKDGEELPFVQVTLEAVEE
jgi:hypothetical protein